MVGDKFTFFRGPEGEEGTINDIDVEDGVTFWKVTWDTGKKVIKFSMVLHLQKVGVLSRQ